MGDDSLSAWITHGRTALCQKDSRKGNAGNAVDNYCPITCFLLMPKLLTRVIAEDMYDYLKQEKLLPEEPKGCRRRSRETKDQLLIDKTVLKDCKEKPTNLSIAWIDFKKAYDFIPHSWINECVKLYGIVDDVRNFLKKKMEQWKLSLTSNSEELGEVDV